MLAADQGGYFPHTWPWAALAFAAAAALVAVMADNLRVQGSGLVLVGGLAALSAWTLLSGLWSLEPQTSLQEATRTPIYVAAALALVLLAAAAGPEPLLAGLTVGITAIAAYSLADRIVNGSHPTDQQSSLLERPLGYANALGALCAVALVVLCGLAATRTRTRRWRAAAVVAGAVLATALALTDSRGGWLAAAIGLAVVAAVSAKSRLLLRLAVGAGATVLLSLLIVTAFTQPPRLQPRSDYWHVAWHVAGQHLLVGTGAGSYDLMWAAYGNLARWGDALDAHSLYLETLAELGIVGLVLVSTLAAPVVAALRRRPSQPVLAASLGGATTFLIHAGLDWDWEMPAVTFAGIACLAAISGTGERPLWIGPRLRTAALALAAAIIVAYAAFLALHST